MAEPTLAANVMTLESTPSTMDEARRLLGRRPAPFVVLADHQSAGRGRMGRVWHSAPGLDLTFTAALAFGDDPPVLPPFTLAVGVALHEAIEATVVEAGADASMLTLKWPNDVLVDRRKLAGVLCESVDDTVLVGVGLNVGTERFPDEISEIATSMRILTGAEVDRERFLERVLERIERTASLFARHGFSAFGAGYASRCRLWGQRVKIEQIEGTMYGVDGTGALTIRQDDGTTSVVSSGHVELISSRSDRLP